MTRILIAVDQAPADDLVAIIAARPDCEVLEAPDGPSALQLLESEHPDLVMADIPVPGMDDYEFVRRLRSRPDLVPTPVIFFADARDEQEAQSLARACGSATVLLRPCPPKLIHNAINSCLKSDRAGGPPHGGAAADTVAELKRTRELLRTILDYSPSLIYLKDARGRYLLANRALQEHLGLSGEELEGKSDSDLLPTGLAEKARRDHEHAIGAQNPFEVEEETRHGTETRSFRTTRFSLPDENGEPYAAGAISTETTEQRRQRRQLAEYALEVEGRSRLTACLEELSAEAVTQTAEHELPGRAALLMGRALRADCFRVMEVPRDGEVRQVVAQGWIGPAPRHGDPGLFSGVLAAYAAASGKAVLANRLERETRFAGKSLADESGLGSAIAVTIENRRNACTVIEIFSRRPDVFTEEHLAFLRTGANIVAGAVKRGRALEDLRSTRSYLTRLIAASPAVIYSLNVKGNALEPNIVGGNIARITGYSVKEAMRAEWWEQHAHPDELLQAVEAETANRTGRLLTREYTLTRPDGKTIWVRDESRIFPAARGLHPEIVGSFSDVTEQKMLEEQLRRTQKMESFGQLASGIAHDFNNQLTVIYGFAQFELANSELEQPTRHALETISKAAAGAIDLTSQVASFSRRQTPAPQEIDLGAVIESRVELFRRVIGADVRLNTQLHADLPLVHADTDKVEQLLLILVVNAREAMPRGGDLNIRIYPVTFGMDDVRPGSERQPGDFVCLEVRDTGRGMNQETQANIFKPFFTTKEAGKGVGLGLTTAQAIVRQHQGWIEVESAAGRGATFRAFFPAVSRTAVPDEPTAAARPQDSDVTILLVEDDELVRSVTEMFLKKLAYRTLTADSASAAEALLKQPDLRVDLLMTDMVLPGTVSGPDLAEKARQLRPGLPVLFTSANPTDRSGKAPRLEEGRNFVRKPFELNQLAAAIRRCLAGEHRTAAS